MSCKPLICIITSSKAEIGDPNAVYFALAVARDQVLTLNIKRCRYVGVIKCFYCWTLHQLLHFHHEEVAFSCCKYCKSSWKFFPLWPKFKLLKPQRDNQSSLRLTITSEARQARSVVLWQNQVNPLSLTSNYC